MAETSWTRSLTNLFKKKAVALSPESCDSCLGFSRQCLKEVRTMTSPPASKSSKFINFSRCLYLVDSLDKAVHKASLFLEHKRHPGGYFMPTEDVRENALELFKILCTLAHKVKCFIHGCCNGHWFRMAVVLKNLSDCTASVGFDLKLITILLPPYSHARIYSLFPLIIDEVSNLMYVEHELVKEMASYDEHCWVMELKFKIQSGVLSSDDLELAIFLLERSVRLEQSSRPESPQPILHERDLTNLKDLIQIARGGYGTVHKASWLGIDVAVKTFYGIDNPEFNQEVSILAGLSHLNIVSFLFHGKDMGECCIVMELMDRDLFSLMKERLRSDRTRSSPSPCLKSMTSCSKSQRLWITSTRGEFCTEI